MKTIKTFLSVLLIFALLFTTSFYNNLFKVSAQTVTTAYIEGSNVNVRKAPDRSASIIEKISYTSATVLNSVTNSGGTWYQITYHNGSEQITGYIFYDSSYIRIVTYNPDASFDEKLKSFPESYRESLRQLHAAYPNWEFIPDYINISFDDAVALQSSNLRKQVQVTGDSVSWRSMGTGSYNWNTGTWANDNGGWTGASREVIAYYMDARNFLNSKEIFQFMRQTYSQAPTEADVNKILSGSFMANGYTTFSGDAYGGSYAKVFLQAGKESGVDPCVLAALVLQEQGYSGTSSLISGNYSGYVGYYNFFNISASGADKTAVIVNGLKKAKAEGWNSIPSSIIGGAKFYKSRYITRYSESETDVKNQNTYYYQDFNMYSTNDLWHQYAQAAHDANSKGSILGKTYLSNPNYKFVFRIPIYNDMPSSPSPLPAKSTKKNNYYFSSVTVDGLTPSFDMFTYSYDLMVNGDTTVYVKPVSGATYAGSGSYSIKKGSNKIELKVKSETGYITNYVLNIDSSSDCTLIVNSGGTIIKGDTNGDGQISIADLANVRLNLLSIYGFNEYQKTAADTNADGQITIADLANIRLHLLGLYTIK